MWLFYLIWKCQGQFKKIKCLFLNKGYSNKTDEKLKKGFKNNLSFLVMISINLFFLRKFVYLDGYMDDCKKFNETTLPKKEVL